MYRIYEYRADKEVWERLHFGAEVAKSVAVTARHFFYNFKFLIKLYLFNQKYVFL